MANEHIATYLNDHLAGSVAAVELLEHLGESYRDSEIGKFVVGLSAEIEADRQTLKTLMQRLGVDESVTRKASAWFAGKVTELKLRFDDSEEGDFRLFESFEGLSLGIEGKRTLWVTLAKLAESDATLRVFDYHGLARRAEDQRNSVEERRLESAKTALLKQSDS